MYNKYNNRNTSTTPKFSGQDCKIGMNCSADFIYPLNSPTIV